MLRSILLGLLTLVPLALAVDITGHVALDALPGRAVPIGSKAILDNGARTALVLSDGSYLIDGEHIVETIVPGYSLPKTFYTVQDDSVHAQPYIPNKLPLATSAPSIPLPVRLVPARDEYYTAAQGVNVLGMLKSPMVLMMVFSGVMMLGLPKLMSMMEMDEDMVKDVAETRKKMHGMQNMDFMGSLSSMLAGETPAGPVTAPTQSKAAAPASNTGSSGAGGRRRKGR